MPFSQVCQDKLLRLRYNTNPRVPWAKRFTDHRGVTVRVLHYGSVRSAPGYQPLFHALESAGWVADKDIRVAGYDSRLTPDQGGFLCRTVALIEQTYHQNGNHRVFLVGHSNGPLYAQYLLTHTSQVRRDKYIAGFTPLAGNFPGQGSLYAIAFTGLNVKDFTYPTTHANAVSSSLMYLSAPSTYMSAADPAIFGRREIVVRDASTGRDYTPADYPRLFRDAALPQAGAIAKHYIGFVKFADPAHFPNVDVWAERGSGLDTVVGAALPKSRPGSGDHSHHPLLHPRRRHQPGEHHQPGRPQLESHARLPLQPDRQPRRQPLRTAEQSGRARTPRPPRVGRALGPNSEGACTPGRCVSDRVCK